MNNGCFSKRWAMGRLILNTISELQAESKSKSEVKLQKSIGRLDLEETKFNLKAPSNLSLKGQLLKHMESSPCLGITRESETQHCKNVGKIKHKENSPIAKVKSEFTRIGIITNNNRDVIDRTIINTPVIENELNEVAQNKGVSSLQKGKKSYKAENNRGNHEKENSHVNQVDLIDKTKNTKDHSYSQKEKVLMAKILYQQIYSLIKIKLNLAFKTIKYHQSYQPPPPRISKFYISQVLDFNVI